MTDKARKSSSHKKPDRDGAVADGAGGYPADTVSEPEPTGDKGAINDGASG